MQYLEIYIKENNLLQLPLFFFQKRKKSYISHEWKQDSISYKVECDCRLGLPGAFEKDIYTACMRIWVKNGMPDEGIETNYSEIASEMKISARDNNQRIKAAMEKLAKARYKLTGCFLSKGSEGTVREDYEFSLFTEAETFTWRKGRSKKKSRFVLLFPEKIKSNLQAKYYQKLDFAWYRALPEGLPRRLYEYIDKRRYHGINGVFSISEEWICLWLPITDQHTTRRRALLERISGELVKAGYLKKYEFDAERKLCRFTYAKPGPPPEKMEAIEVQGCVVDATTSTQVQTSPETVRATSSVTWGEVIAVQEWLESIPYMHKRKIKAIASLPVDQVAAVYPSIRAEYERQAAEGQLPGPAWIYEQFRQHTTAPEPTTTVPHRQEVQQALFDELEEQNLMWDSKEKDAPNNASGGKLLRSKGP